MAISLGMIYRARHDDVGLFCLGEGSWLSSFVLVMIVIIVIIVIIDIIDTIDIIEIIDAIDILIGVRDGERTKWEEGV